MVRGLALAGASFVACGAPAFAQSAAPATSSRTTAYQAAYFAQFAPRTALDIAQHVPGFQLDLGSTQGVAGNVDVRGFAGTAGNVVINGARPSTKSETIDVTLQRIPAQRVVRVELGSGDLYGSDYVGKSQVLNVVLSDAGGIDANVTVSALRRYQGYVQKNVTANALIRKGPSTFNLSAGTGYNKQYEEGTDTLTDTATGNLVEFRRKHNVYANKNPFIAAAYALEHGGDDAYRINLRWQPSRFDLFQRNRVSPDGLPQHDDNLIQHSKDPVFDLGADRPVNRRRDGEGEARRGLRQPRQAAVPLPARRWRRALRILQPQGTRRRHRGPDAEIPQTQHHPGLEARWRVAHPIVGQTDRRPARLLRFHQLRRPFDEADQRRQRRP